MKKIVIFVLFAVFWALASCSMDRTWTQDSISDTELWTQKQDVLAQKSEDTGFTLPEKFMKDAQFQTCVKQNIDMCIEEQSYVQTSPSPSCSDYLLEENQQMCHRQETITSAKQAQDISLCDTLTNGKEACKYELIIALNPETEDLSLCDTLGKEYSSLCHNTLVSKWAVREKNASICDKILTESEQDSFEQEFCREEAQFQQEQE